MPKQYTKIILFNNKLGNPPKSQLYKDCLYQYIDQFKFVQNKNLQVQLINHSAIQNKFINFNKHYIIRVKLMQELSPEPSADTQKSQHEFFIRKLDPNFPKAFLSVSFQPIFSKQHNQFRSSFPVFKNDKRSYIPTFFIPGLDNQMQQVDAYFQNLHQKRVYEATRQKKELFLPKPSSKNSCCIICQSPFEDYLTHINSSDHQQKLEKSKFNFYINQLCQQMNGKRSLEKKEVSVQKKMGMPRKRRNIGRISKVDDKITEAGSSPTLDSLNCRISVKSQA